ncbi:MAG: hypothetical protein QG638_2040, partial [Pseudomonadota bacterium]|nr:hypothetical protein [Pseudomonadota bacterium]
MALMLPETLAIQQMRNAIDPVKFADIKQRYQHIDPNPGFSKFVDLDTFLPMTYMHFRYAGLEKVCTPLDILDLGTGAGYFPLLCQLKGHQVQATDLPISADLPATQFYGEMMELLGVRCFGYRIQPFTPLPGMGGRFDLITAFLVVFNNHCVENLWTAEEWAFFLDDLRKTHAKPHARLVLRLNRDPQGPEGKF